MHFVSIAHVHLCQAKPGSEMKEHAGAVTEFKREAGQKQVHRRHLGLALGQNSIQLVVHSFTAGHLRGSLRQFCQFISALNLAKRLTYLDTNSILGLPFVIPFSRIDAGQSNRSLNPTESHPGVFVSSSSTASLIAHLDPRTRTVHAMSVVRKLSLSRKKKDKDETPLPRSPSVRGDKPPKSRVLSDATSLTSDADSMKPKRKFSLR